MKRTLSIKMVAATLAIFIASGLIAFAQQISLDVQPRAIRLNEAATLKLNFINLNPPQAPNLPAINGFDIQYIGQEQHFQITNGQQERRLTYNYQLQPHATGTYEIGPFNIDINGQRIDIGAVAVEVLPPASGGNANQTLQDLIFARITLPRPEVFLQERFDVILSLYYQNIQIDRGVQLQNLPDTGLNFDEFEEIGGTREALNGEIYEVRRFRLRGTAITAGSFAFAPSVRVNVLVRRERQRDPFFGGFDDFFLGRHQTQPLQVPAEPITIVIRSLPTGERPDGFGGAVGRFDMDASVQPTELTAGEPVTLTIRITGRGNFESLSMPPFNPGDDFRRYDPKLISASRDHKIFEQVFIPRSDAVKEIPPVSFSYFDPELASYQTITRGPYPLQVKAGASTDPQLVQMPAAVAAANRAPLGIDLIDLKRTLITRDTDPGELAALSPAIHLLPLFALAGLLVVQRRRERFMSDISRQRRSQAPRSARKAIQAAEVALAGKDTGAFHQALWQSLADYVAHRCNLEAGQVSPELIMNKSRAGGLPQPLLEQLDDLLRACDEARFAASAMQADDLPRRLQVTRDILRGLERIKLS